jgi:hypothetical protein
MNIDSIYLKLRVSEEGLGYFQRNKNHELNELPANPPFTFKLSPCTFNTYTPIPLYLYYSGCRPNYYFIAIALAARSIPVPVRHSEREVVPWNGRNVLRQKCRPIWIRIRLFPVIRPHYIAELLQGIIPGGEQH